MWHPVLQLVKVDVHLILSTVLSALGYTKGLHHLPQALTLIALPNLLERLGVDVAYGKPLIH